MDLIDLLNINKNISSYCEIDSDLVICVICLKLCNNAMETNCCHSLLCELCTDLLFKNTRKCPTCRQVTFIYPSIIIRKLILSIKESCPICGTNVKRSNMYHHLKEEHKDNSNDELLKKYCFKIFEDSLPNIISNKTHLHELILSINSNDFICRGKLFYKKCYVKSDNPQFYYMCKLCDIHYCTNCAKNSQEIFEVKTHSHKLKYVNKDNGWMCDGPNCKSIFNTFNKTYGFRRFRCEHCDYDLCEKCLENNII